MSEKTTNITQARAKLPKLVESCAGMMERYILTNRGEAQAVLLGYEDYRAIMAALKIAQNPELQANLQQSEREIEEGKVLSHADAMKRLQHAAGVRGKALEQVD